MQSKRCGRVNLHSQVLLNLLKAIRKEDKTDKVTLRPTFACDFISGKAEIFVCNYDCT